MEDALDTVAPRAHAVTLPGEGPRIVHLQVGPAKNEVAALTSAVRDLIDHQVARDENERIHRQDEARAAAQLGPELQQRAAAFWPFVRPRLEGRAGQVDLLVHREQFTDHFGDLPPETARRVLEAVAEEARRDREAWDPACTGLRLALAAAPPAPAAPPEPAALEDCPVVHVPVLHEVFVACFKRAQALGLMFPHADRFTVFWVNAPAFRRADGTTTFRAATGEVAMYLHVGIRDLATLQRAVYHELQHAADYHRHGLALAVKEMESRAEAFARRAMAPPPSPKEPEPEAGSPWRGRRSGGLW